MRRTATRERRIRTTRPIVPDKPRAAGALVLHRVASVAHVVADRADGVLRLVTLAMGGGLLGWWGSRRLTEGCDALFQADVLNIPERPPPPGTAPRVP
jgi:hypothetical protein